MAYSHDPNDKTVQMTANNAPAPNVVSASNTYSTYYAWKAFDHNSDLVNSWYGQVIGGIAWLKFDFGSALHAATYYNICAYPEYPTAWKFQGSNNDSDWVDLDTRSGVTMVSGETYKYEFENETAYRFYRLYMTSFSAGYVGIRELEICAPAGPQIVSCGPISVAAGMNAKLKIGLSAGAFAVTAGFSAGNIFVGRFITAGEPVSVAAKLWAALRIDVSVPAIDVKSDLKAKTGIALSVSPLSVETGLSIKDIFLGRFIVVGPFASVADLQAKVGITLVSPPLSAAPGLSCRTAIAVPISPFNVAGGLSVGGMAGFIDRNYRITYVCKLGNLVLPVTSFQARFKNGGPSFLSVVVPGLLYAEDIEGRTGDALQIYLVKTYSDGNQTMEMLGEVTQDALSVDEGETSQSITIDGHKEVTHTPKIVTLRGAQYRAVTYGAKRYRCRPNFSVKPGDTVKIGDDSFVAATVTWAVAVDREFMEVAEDKWDGG